MNNSILQIFYRISLSLLTASILLLLFFIVVTGAEDWVLTMLGWFTLIFSASSVALFYLEKRNK